MAVCMETPGRTMNNAPTADAQREQWADVARGMGIIAVVAGHTFAPTSNATQWIFAFHMPLFFILSGYFFSIRGGFKVTAARRAKALLVPYVATVAIYLIYTVLVLGRPQHIESWIASLMYASGKEIQQFPAIEPIGPMWFLPALFAASLIAYGIESMFGKWAGKLLGIGLAVAAGIAIGRYIFLPLSIDVALVVQLYLFFGLAARRQQWIDSAQRLALAKWLVLGLCAIALVVERYDVVTSLNNRDYRHFAVQVAGAIGGSVLVIWAATVIARHRLAAVPLAYIGRAAIVILCFHVVDTGYAQFNRLPGFDVIEGHLWLHIAFRIAFSLALYEAFRRVPALRWCYGLTAPRRSISGALLRWGWR